MATYQFSSPLTGSKVEELLLRVNNNATFTSADEAKLDGLENQAYVREDSFVNTTSQTGSPIDVPRNVVYGPLKTSASGLIRHNADGTLDILKGGPFAFKTRHRVSRTGASGTTHMFFWVEVSTDNGLSWTITGQPQDIRLETSADSRTFFDFTTDSFPAGTKIRARFARSSTGSDFGSLEPATGSAALTSLGVTPVPSAQLTVYKVQGWNYV